MTTKHPSDDELQQYVLNDGSINKDIAAHINACEDCKGRVETYRVLIMGIEQLPVPVFEFDLQELVLSQLPAPVEKNKESNLSPWVFIGPSVITAGLIIYFFGGYFPRLLTGIATLANGLVVVSACILATASPRRGAPSELETVPMMWDRAGSTASMHRAAHAIRRQRLPRLRMRPHRALSSDIARNWMAYAASRS